MGLSWGRKEEDTPEELRGLTPQQIADAVKRSKELETEVTSLKTKLGEREAADVNTQTEFEALKTRLQAIETGAGGGGERRTEPNPNQRQLTSFLVNEDQAFAERALPLAAMTMDTRKMVAKDIAMRKLGPNFVKWEKDIDALAVNVPLANLGVADTWEHLYYNIKGRKDHEAELAAANAENAGNGKGNAGGGGDDKKTTLTDEEKKIAKKLGVTEEVYGTNKAAMLVAPDMGT